MKAEKNRKTSNREASLDKTEILFYKLETTYNVQQHIAKVIARHLQEERESIAQKEKSKGTQP